MLMKHSKTVRDLREELKRLIRTYGKEVDQYGTIVSPGRFEGEPAYILYYYDLTLESSEDEHGYTPEDTPYSVFYITPVEREAFDLDPSDEVLVMFHLDSGFVHSEILTKEEWKRFQSEMDKKMSEMEDGGKVW